MKILKIQALRGPNIWSVQRKKLIQMRLDLEELEELPTNKIPGFRERIENLLPTLVEHRCSEGTIGGFFHRIDRGLDLVAQEKPKHPVFITLFFPIWKKT